MKLYLLPLSILAAGLLAGCNPDPNPPSAPDGTTAPISGNAVDGDRYTANTITVRMNKVTAGGIGDSAGTIIVRETADGLIFKPELEGLQEGEHGFHIHQNPSCEPAMKDGERQAAAGAGSHFDPANTNQHAGPDGDGHRGDLPRLRITDNALQQEVVAGELTLKDVRNRTLVVHQRADDYSTDPAGDSGPAVACGVVR